MDGVAGGGGEFVQCPTDGGGFEPGDADVDEVCVEAADAGRGAFGAGTSFGFIMLGDVVPKRTAAAEQFADGG